MPGICIKCVNFSYRYIFMNFAHTCSIEMFHLFIEDLLGHLNTGHCVPVLVISVDNSSSILD